MQNLNTTPEIFSSKLFLILLFHSSLSLPLPLPLSSYFSLSSYPPLLLNVHTSLSPQCCYRTSFCLLSFHALTQQKLLQYPYSPSHPPVHPLTLNTIPTSFTFSLTPLPFFSIPLLNTKKLENSKSLSLPPYPSLLTSNYPFLPPPPPSSMYRFGLNISP